jgi:prepilin-type N-terminal cleavage/methylation domain-containing protein
MTKIFRKALRRCGARLGAGFTLIEVLIAMAIMGGILFLIANFGLDIAKTSTFVEQSFQNLQGLDLAFRVMTTEIRSAAPSSLGAYPVESAASSSFIFFSDIDGNGIFERVRYFIATSSFQKSVIKPTGNPLVYATSSEVITMVIPDVIAASSSFSYFDGNYTGTENPLSFPVDILRVRTVKVRVAADVNPGVSPEPTIFDATVTLRNLKDN